MHLLYFSVSTCLNYNCSSPVPVRRVIGVASLVEAPLGQRLLLVQDKLLESHLHLCTGHSTCGVKKKKKLRNGYLSKRELGSFTITCGVS